MALPRCGATGSWTWLGRGTATLSAPAIEQQGMPHGSVTGLIYRHTPFA